MYCSEELSEVVRPWRPVRGRTIVCGEQFDTALIQEAIRVRRNLTYGVVAIDGGEATLGTVQVPADGSRCSGALVSKVAHLSANIASRTRRGGQSALRYSRNRDGEELEFLRKVSEQAQALSDVRGLILGGRADMKRKLLAELPGELRARVARVVDLRCSAGDEALRTVSALLGEIVDMDLHKDSEAAVAKFMDLVARADGSVAASVCYGLEETVAALRLGAVEVLLVASASSQRLGCNIAELRKPAAASGATVIDVKSGSSLSARFCEGFGIAAHLRYSVDPVFLDPPAYINEFASDEFQKPASVDSDTESVSTSASRHDDRLISWLQEALKECLHDASAAESLAVCAELILFDESMPAEDRIESAAEMLRAEAVPEEVLAELVCHAWDRLPSRT